MVSRRSARFGLARLNPVDQGTIRAGKIDYAVARLPRASPLSVLRQSGDTAGQRRCDARTPAIRGTSAYAIRGA
jgi:hypothetical protein